MATVDLSHVQFWQPPLYRNNGRSGSITGSRNQPASLHNKADEVLKRDNQAKSLVTATHCRGRNVAQHGDNAVGAQGRDNTNCDNAADDDLPSIKERWGQIFRQGISIGEYWDSEDTTQHLEEPAPDTSRSHHSPTCLAPDNGAGDSQGTQERPVILEEDDSDTLNPKAAAVSTLMDASADPTFDLSKPIDPSSHGAWWDVEDGGFVDADLRPFPPLEHDGLPSMTMLAQGQSYSHHQSPGLLYDRISQHGGDQTTGGVLDEPASHSLLTPLEENGGGGSHENATKLKRDMQLAFEEQDKSLSATTPSSHHPYRPSAEPPRPQIGEENDQSETGYGRLQGLRQGSPLRSQNPEKEPQEQQQRQQELAVEASRKGEEDDEERRRGEKRRHQDEAEEIGSGSHPKGSDHSYDTSDEDDEDPQPAKRRKLPPVPTNNALTPSDKPTPVDNDDHHTSRTSRSPSTVESAPVAEYQEWPFQGFLKRTRIGDETTYNLEFQLAHVPEHLHLPFLSEALGIRSKETPAKAITPCNASTHSKVYLAEARPQKRVRWTPEEDAKILKMREDRCSWEEIHAALPRRTKETIQVRYSTKLKR